MTNFFTHKFREKSPIEIFVMIVFGAIFISGLVILFGYVVMWLWNWLMPDIFGLPLLSYWQAVGLFILLKLLLGGCSMGSGNKKSSKDSNKKCKDNSKTDFSKWKYYNKFWEEEGDKYFQQYVERQSNPSQKEIPNSESE
ncbi:hypothetical protein [uncultured Psychroserpens sp.]|uniref:hypothetical protein n=1 Tax=uncultured Psychroserpens sp. TaxID=255436 RepID=UPI002615621A|nr:hypothetical protein [uncultured Psychroserpens sp.]